MSQIFIEAGIDKNLAHRARSAAGVPAEKFEQIIKQGREQITAESDRVTAKLVAALVVVSPLPLMVLLRQRCVLPTRRNSRPRRRPKSS
jgi:hypothetical protein